MDRDTLAAYDRDAATYQANRPPRHGGRAEALVADLRAGSVVLDAGCGTGAHLPHLAPPDGRVVGADLSAGMLALAAEAHASPLVQADLRQLPFATGSLAALFARNSLVHTAQEDVPLLLADWHRSLAVGAPMAASFAAGADTSFTDPDDDVPGRTFVGWSEQRLHDVVVGAGFDELVLEPDDGFTHWTTSRRARSLPDRVGPGMRLLVCGLNPSLHAADAGVGFVTNGNRFWPAALQAGLVSVDRDPRHAVVHHGLGFTDLVKRASPKADVLTTAEYRDGLARVERLAAWLQPSAIAFVGLAGWRAAVDRKATAGVQDRRLGGRPVYVLPSSSGLNAGTPLSAFVDHLAAAAALADAS